MGSTVDFIVSYHAGGRQPHARSTEVVASLIGSGGVDAHVEAAMTPPGRTTRAISVSAPAGGR